MALFACKCLNVIITVDTDAVVSEFKLSSVSGESDDHQLLTRESFFGYAVLSVRSRFVNVQVAQKWLLHHKQKCNWIIHKCINCGIPTHCVAAEVGDNMLVNATMQSDQESVAALMSLDEFSPVFNILVSEENIWSGKTTPIGPACNSLSTNSLPTLEDLAAKYLSAEREAANKRIRMFTESEHAKLFQLEERIQQDKSKLVQKLMSFQETELLLDSTVSAADFLDHSNSIENSSISNQTKQAKSDFLPLKPTTVMGKAAVDDINFDDSTLLFPMDQEDKTGELNPDDNIQGFSDDEEERPSYMRSSPGVEQFSTSVPINVPCLKSSNPRFEAALEESPTSPSDIGASIQALAKSLHGDGSEIFGDLPRAPQPKGMPSDYPLVN